MANGNYTRSINQSIEGSIEAVVYGINFIYQSNFSNMQQKFKKINMKTYD